MKQKVIIPFLSILVFSILPVSAQNVTNVEFWQDGKNVKISYELDRRADIKIAISTDGGKTFSSPLKQVTGSVGKNVTPGKKTIVWDVLSEHERLVGENICFRVTASTTKKDKKINIRVNGVSFSLIRVKGGTFTMGATAEQMNPSEKEKPTHKVSLSSYYIGETEVSQELWQAVMGNNPSYFKGNNNPVENVSWNECQEFIKRLNSLTGEALRLPTEAEWEYAARGGSKNNSYQYSGNKNPENVAWFDGNTEGKTHPIATKSPNKLGIYDMSGNVWEMCQDQYNYYNNDDQHNPFISYSKHIIVQRGGSWDNNEWTSRVSYRDACLVSDKSSNMGFRLAMSVDPLPWESEKPTIEHEYTVIETQPTFPGNINNWLALNIKYPPVAAENGIEGRVIVQLVVGKDGFIKNADVIRGVDPSLDKEAIRVVKSMPRWTPGKQNGQSVNCKFILPIVFGLN